MAFSGLTVACAFAGSLAARDKSQPIMGKIVWTEEPASGTPTASVAPGVSDAAGQPIFRIRAAADSWVAIGKMPNASAAPRILVPANTDYDVFVDAGDKLAWVAA